MPFVLWKPLMAMGVVLWVLLCIWSPLRVTRSGLVGVDKLEQHLEASSLKGPGGVVTARVSRVHWELVLLFVVIVLWLFGKKVSRYVYTGTGAEHPTLVALTQPTDESRSVASVGWRRDATPERSPSVQTLHRTTRHLKRLHGCVRTPRVPSARATTEPEPSGSEQAGQEERVSRALEATSRRLTRCLSTLEKRRKQLDARPRTDQLLRLEPERLHACIQTFGKPRLEPIAEEGEARRPGVATVARKVRECTSALATLLEMDQHTVDEQLQQPLADSDTTPVDTPSESEIRRVDMRLMKLMLEHLEHDVETLKKRRSDFISGSEEFQRLCDNLHQAYSVSQLPDN